MTRRCTSLLAAVVMCLRLAPNPGWLRAVPFHATASQGAQESHPLDLWADEDLGATPGPGSEAAAKQQQQKGSRKQQRKEKKLLAGASGASGAGTGPTLLRVMGPSVKPLRKSPPPQRLPAVPVDLPGCSYNPDHEHHQVGAVC